TVGVTPKGEMFSMSDGRTTIQARAVAVTKWVPTDQVIGATAKARTTVPADDLANAIKAAEVTRPDGTGVRVTVRPDEFPVSSEDNETGAQSTIPIEDFEHTGPGLVIYLNPRIFIPALGLCGT